MNRPAQRLALAVFLAAGLAACAGRPDPAAEEAKLMETSRAWSRAAAAGDVDAILAYWADDALVVPPGRPPMRGKKALRTYLETSMRTPGFRIGWEPLEAKVSKHGDMGYLVERTTVTVDGPDGKPVTHHFRGVTIWRRQADGSWRNVVDINNPEPAPAPRP